MMLTSYEGENNPKDKRNYYRHENRSEINCDDQVKPPLLKKKHVYLNPTKHRLEIKIRSIYLRLCYVSNVVGCSGKRVFYLSYWNCTDRLQSWYSWSWSDINI